MAVPTTFADLSTTPATNVDLVAESDSVNVIDNHFRVIYVFIKSVEANTATNGWTSPYFALNGGTITGDTTVQGGVFWVGDSSTLGSDDPQIVISRDVDSGTAGNGHAFTDSSTVNRSGDVSYNSYDCRVTFAGAHDYGHYAAFQVGPTLSTSGTIGDLFSFYSYPAINEGTLTNYYGLYVQPPAITGTGAVTNAYGMFVPLSFSAGTSGVDALNYVLYNASDAPIYSAGAIQADLGLSAGNGAGASYTPTRTIDAVTASGTAAGLRLQQLTQNFWDFTVPANQTYLTISNATGTVVKITADKSVVYSMGTSVPTLANGEGALTFTSDTNVRISYRGSDGTLRAVNLTME